MTTTKPNPIKYYCKVSSIKFLCTNAEFMVAPESWALQLYWLYLLIFLIHVPAFVCVYVWLVHIIKKLYYHPLCFPFMWLICYVMPTFHHLISSHLLKSSTNLYLFNWMSIFFSAKQIFLVFQKHISVFQSYFYASDIICRNNVNFLKVHCNFCPSRS